MRQPDPSAQHRAPVLDVWASFRGFAVGFIGGPVREIIQEFGTLDEAFAAYRRGPRGKRSPRQGKRDPASRPLIRRPDFTSPNLDPEKPQCLAPSA